MTPSEVKPPGQPFQGAHKVYATSGGRRGWQKLCQSHANVMRRCYIDLADAPFPAAYSQRHHRLKGKLRDFWEWEVGGGERVRYKATDNGDPVVVYAGPAPSDTH